VFPAPAGMNRHFLALVVVGPGVPRARGDEPSSTCSFAFSSACSPRARGWDRCNTRSR
jgi:hypothetical protein